MPIDPTPNPKFQQHIRDTIREDGSARTTGKFGIVSAYDRQSNTATILLMDNGSDVVKDILEKVPCPYYPGMQLAAPRPGQPCWVVFRGTGQNDSRPLISHYFSHDYYRHNYFRQNSAKNGIMQHHLAM